MKDISNKIALGTVQFGLNYGIANKQGVTSSTEVKEIIRLASLHGIHILDTAIGYGDSEKKLGEVGVKDFDIITKLPAIPDDYTDIEKWVEMQINGSLERLNVEQLYGVLFHTPSQLNSLKGKQLFRALENMKEKKVIGKIGISVYSPEELDILIEDYDVDIVQAPFNIIDRRFHESGWFSKLSSLGIEVHVRSVFLQGLLLMKISDRSAYFDKWKSLFGSFSDWLMNQKLTPLQACLNYVLGFSEIDKVLIGVDNSANLLEILNAKMDGSLHVPNDFGSRDVDLIIPTNWKKN